MRRWRFFASCICSEPSAACFRPASYIRTKATPCVEVWQTDIQSPTAEISRGKKTRKKEQTIGWKYRWSALLHRVTIKRKSKLKTKTYMLRRNGLVKSPMVLVQSLEKWVIKFHSADAKMILTAPQPENWKRPPGHPRITWLNTIQQDLRSYNLTPNEAVGLAQNRPLWRLMSMCPHYALLVLHARKEEELWLGQEWMCIHLLIIPSITLGHDFWCSVNASSRFCTAHIHDMVSDANWIQLNPLKWLAVVPDHDYLPRQSIHLSILCAEVLH